MANISLREAVKHFDVSRPTLQKALKTGKISGKQDGQGHWLIDPSELARVYQARAGTSKSTLNDAVNIDRTKTTDVTTAAQEGQPHSSELFDLKMKLLEAEKRAEIAEALARERELHIEDLRRMLPAPTASRKWWPWSR